MNGGAEVADQTVSADGPDWILSAAADFNGDRQARHLVAQRRFGPVVLWTMDGANKVRRSSVSNHGGIDWNRDSRPISTVDASRHSVSATTSSRSRFGHWTARPSSPTRSSPTWATTLEAQRYADFTNGRRQDRLRCATIFGAIAVWTMNGAHEGLLSCSSPISQRLEGVRHGGLQCRRQADILLRTDFVRAPSRCGPMTGGVKVADQLVSNLGNDWQVLTTTASPDTGKATSSAQRFRRDTLCGRHELLS